jgi:hypothetical protein
LAGASDSGVPGVKILEGEGFVLIDDRLACIAGGDLVVTLAVCGDAILDWRWARWRWCLGGGRGASDDSRGFGSRSARNADANVIIEPQAGAACTDCRVPFVADGLLDLARC